MINKLSTVGFALAISAGVLAPVSPASAQDYRGDYHDSQRYSDDYRGRDYDRRDYRDDYYRDHQGRANAYYRGERHDHYDRRTNYRDDRYNRRCSDGTGGTIIGAIFGGILGNAVAGHHDRGTGTILGAAGGALAGRAIDRSNCRR